MILNKLKCSIVKLINHFIASQHTISYTPSYRIVEIIENEDQSYVVRLQIINKSIIINAKPEEILADDTLVDKFSPRDIRTLTYLGYLGINSPKYKILAQRLSEANDKLVFAVRERGKAKLSILEADAIIKSEEILTNLSPKDAHLVGYTVASENIYIEKITKNKLKKQKEIIND